MQQQQQQQRRQPGDGKRQAARLVHCSMSDGRAAAGMPTERRLLRSIQRLVPCKVTVHCKGVPVFLPCGVMFACFYKCNHGSTACCTLPCHSAA
jgi:hypothetical protein